MLLAPDLSAVSWTLNIVNARHLAVPELESFSVGRTSSADSELRPEPPSAN